MHRKLILWRNFKIYIKKLCSAARWTILYNFAPILAAFYGVLFPNNEEAAFSNYRLWESVGFIVAFAYTSYISMVAKLIVLIVVLCFGMAGYACVVIYNKKWQKEEEADEPDTASAADSQY